MSKLLQMLDRVRPEVNPLDDHYISELEPLNRDRYLTLLATNLLELGALSEARSRLFEMLISAIHSERPASFYMQQAASLTHDELRETLLFLRDDDDNQEIAKAFLFDLMILLRIDGPISVATAELLAQQYTTLSLDVNYAKIHMFWLEYCLQGRIDMSILDGIEIVDDVEVVYAEYVTQSDSDITAQHNCENISCQVGDFIDEDNFNVAGKLDNYFDNYFFHYYINKLTLPSGIVLKIYPSVKNFKGHFWSDSGQRNPAVKMMLPPDWMHIWMSDL